jgi:purine-binding chemotaxis protein CheW
MTDYVSFTTAGQLFGLPIEHVQDVFMLANITRVPLAGREIAGVLNLRGRIVTVIDLANRLQLDGSREAHMVIGIDRGSESFGILVDRVGEVLPLSDGDREPNPINLDPTLDAIATGVSGLTRNFLSRSTPTAPWISRLPIRCHAMRRANAEQLLRTLR